jgi:hypothetical protein
VQDRASLRAQQLLLSSTDDEEEDTSEAEVIPHTLNVHHTALTLPGSDIEDLRSQEKKQNAMCTMV